MLEIGWSEILVIAVVAIVVVGPKDLPRLLRTVGQMVGKARRMAGDFQSQFNAALREAEREVDLMDAKKEVESLKGLNPLTSVKEAIDPIRSIGADIKRDLATPMASPAAAAATATAASAEPVKTGATSETAAAAVDVPSPEVVPPAPVITPAPPVAQPQPAPAMTPAPVAVQPEPAPAPRADGQGESR